MVKKVAGLGNCWLAISWAHFNPKTEKVVTSLTSTYSVPDLRWHQRQWRALEDEILVRESRWILSLLYYFDNNALVQDWKKQQAHWLIDRNVQKQLYLLLQWCPSPMKWGLQTQWWSMQRASGWHKEQTSTENKQPLFGHDLVRSSRGLF